MGALVKGYGDEKKVATGFIAGSMDSGLAKVRLIVNGMTDGGSRLPKWVAGS